jgi:hypothetical protein
MADDREAKFLDALYLGAKDGGMFDRAMGLLANQFDCAAATVVDLVLGYSLAQFSLDDFI